MALVDYGDSCSGSDNECSDGEEDSFSNSNVAAALAPAAPQHRAPPADEEVEEAYRGRIPASMQPDALPKPPPTGAAQQLAGNRNEALRASTRKHGRGGKVLIQFAPGATLDSDSDDGEESLRRKVTAGAAPNGRTGLLALLPAPQALTVKEGVKAMIPQSVQRQAAQARVIQRVIKPAPDAPGASFSDEIDVLPEEMAPAFAMASVSAAPMVPVSAAPMDEADEAAVVQARIAALIAADAGQPGGSGGEVAAPRDAARIGQVDRIQQLSDIPEAERVRLEGRRRGVGAAPAFIEVRQAEQLEGVNITMTKGLTTDEDEAAHAKPGKFGGPSVARNKNQITWLAHKAKEREFELKNQWADNKFNKRMSMQKYGF